MTLPNIEGIAFAALRDALPDAHVVTALPSGAKSWPYVRVTRYGGAPPRTRPLIVDRAALQIDVFATTKNAAFALIGGVRDVFADMVGRHPLGWVTGVDLGGLQYLPDDTFDPVIPRYALDVVITAKPTATI